MPTRGAVRWILLGRSANEFRPVPRSSGRRAGDRAGPRPAWRPDASARPSVALRRPDRSDRPMRALVDRHRVHVAVDGRRALSIGIREAAVPVGGRTCPTTSCTIGPPASTSRSRKLVCARVHGSTRRTHVATTPVIASALSTTNSLLCIRRLMRSMIGRPTARIRVQRTTSASVRERVEQPHLDVGMRGVPRDPRVLAAGVEVVDQDANPHAAFGGLARGPQQACFAYGSSLMM